MRHAHHFDNVLSQEGLMQVEELCNKFPQVAERYKIDLTNVLFLTSDRGRAKATAHEVRVRLMLKGLQSFQKEELAVLGDEDSPAYVAAARSIRLRSSLEGFTFVWVVTHMLHVEKVPNLVLGLLGKEPNKSLPSYQPPHCKMVLIDTDTGESWSVD